MVYVSQKIILWFAYKKHKTWNFEKKVCQNFPQISFFSGYFFRPVGNRGQSARGVWRSKIISMISKFFFENIVCSHKRHTRFSKLLKRGPVIRFQRWCFKMMKTPLQNVFKNYIISYYYEYYLWWEINLGSSGFKFY